MQSRIDLFATQPGSLSFRYEAAIFLMQLRMPDPKAEFFPMGKPRPPSTGSDPKVLLIVGYKKVGKTTLIEKLIPELSSRGYRVGTVKHHHSDFPVEVDSQGTDSSRHRRAGASGVALVTADRCRAVR